jgi:phosphoribosylformylglycinamidine synthase subunit PurL
VGLVGGTRIVVVGDDPDTLSGSRWAWRQGHKRGTPPALDFDAHRRVCDAVRDLVIDGLALGVHDTADGGLALALAEMAVASGVGARIRVPREAEASGHRWLLGESPSRFVLAIDPAAAGEVGRRLTVAGVPSVIVGEAGGDRLVVVGPPSAAFDLDLAEATAAWRGRLPDLLGQGTAQG